MWSAVAVWCATVATVVASGVVVGGSISSSAILFAVCMGPLGVALLIGFGEQATTVGELQYAVGSAKEGR
jgi:hypothetical protein